MTLAQRKQQRLNNRVKPHLIGCTGSHMRLVCRRAMRSMGESQLRVLEPFEVVLLNRLEFISGEIVSKKQAEATRIKT